MATAKRPARPTIASPVGIFGYPSLTKPDYGNESFPKPDGEFKTNLTVKLTPAVQAFIDKLMPAYAEAIAEGEVAFAAMPLAQRKKHGKLVEQLFYTEEFDEETEQPTGNVIFKFKTKFKITQKGKNGQPDEIRFNKIALVDASNKPLKAGTLVYGGTKGAVAFQTAPYFVAAQAMAGISLRLVGAQIIDLVGPGVRSGESMGFGVVEGGFSADSAGSEQEPEGLMDGSPASVNGDPSDF